MVILSPVFEFSKECVFYWGTLVCLQESSLQEREGLYFRFSAFVMDLYKALTLGSILVEIVYKIKEKGKIFHVRVLFSIGICNRYYFKSLREKKKRT